MKNFGCVERLIITGVIFNAFDIFHIYSIELMFDGDYRSYAFKKQSWLTWKVQSFKIKVKFWQHIFSGDHWAPSFLDRLQNSEALLDTSWALLHPTAIDDLSWVYSYFAIKWEDEKVVHFCYSPWVRTIVMKTWSHCENKILTAKYNWLTIARWLIVKYNRLTILRRWYAVYTQILCRARIPNFVVNPWSVDRDTLAPRRLSWG